MAQLGVFVPYVSLKVEGVPEETAKKIIEMGEAFGITVIYMRGGTMGRRTQRATAEAGKPCNNGRVY